MTHETVEQNDSKRPAAKAQRQPFAVPLLSAISLLAATALLTLVVIVGPFVWILRDGLGPDAVDSTWLQAVHKMFWTFYWGPATIAATFVFVGASFLRRLIDRSANAVGQEESKTT